MTIFFFVFVFGVLIVKISRIYNFSCAIWLISPFVSFWTGTIKITILRIPSENKKKKPTH